MEEGFTIEEISCMFSVSRKDNLSQNGNLMMSLIRTWRKRRKIFLFVESKCWNFFTKKEAPKECHENWFQTSDLRPRKLRARNFRPLDFCFLIIYIANSSQFSSPNVLWSRNVQRQQPERIEIFIFPGLSLSHRSNSENLTRFKIAADTLINEVCWRMFYRRNRKSESL